MARQSLEGVQTRYRSNAVATHYNQRYTGLRRQLNYRAMCRALRKALRGVPPGSRVLDVPCGTGVFSCFLAGLGYQTFASDISLEMLGVARRARPAESCGETRFLEGDIFQLPFRKRTFDVILCIRFMNLVERPVRIRAVREMARVADRVIVCYYHRYTFKYLSRAVQHRLGLRQPPNPRLTRRELQEEIQESGMRLRQLITVAPALSEAWVAVLERSSA